MSDYEEQDSPILHSKNANSTLTPTDHTSHTEDPSEARSLTVSSRASSFYTAPLHSTLSHSTESIQTVSTQIDSSYHTAQGSSVYTQPSSLQSWAKSSQSHLMSADFHQEDSSSARTRSSRTSDTNWNFAC